MQHETKTIIGIDPGLRQTGIAIMEETEGDRPLLLSTNHITTKKQVGRERRLYQIGVVFFHFCNTRCSIMKNLEFAIETPFIGKNIKSGLALAEVRGVLLYVIGSFSYPVYDYAPTTIKKELIGKGNASKEDVAEFVRIYFGLKEPLFMQDESDAVAVALAHYYITKEGDKDES